MNIQSNVNRAIGTVGTMAKMGQINKSIQGNKSLNVNYDMLLSQKAYSQALQQEADAMNTSLIHKRAALKRLQTMNKITPEKQALREEEINTIEEKIKNRLSAVASLNTKYETTIKQIGDQENGS